MELSVKKREKQIMSEYWVSHKRMDADNTRIVQVRAFIKEKDGLSSPSVYTRQQVIDSIEKNNRWITCIYSGKKDGRDYWKPGREIHVIVIKGTKFIRTDRNETEEDNLGELPDF